MHNISTCTRPMASKHGKMINYQNGLTTIKLYNPLRKWSRKVTSIIKSIKSPVSQ